MEKTTIQLAAVEVVPESLLYPRWQLPPPVLCPRKELLQMLFHHTVKKVIANTTVFDGGCHGTASKQHPCHDKRYR